MAKLPGIKAKHFIISEDCIKTRTKDGAINFALEGIKEEFNKLEECWAGKEAKFHVVLTVESKEI